MLAGLQVGVRWGEVPAWRLMSFLALDFMTFDASGTEGICYSMQMLHHRKRK